VNSLDSEESAQAANELGKRATGGFIWALAGFLAMQIGSFGTYTVATRVLGESGVGVIGAALTVVFFVDVLLDLGMGAALIYEQEEGQTERTQVAFTVNLVVAVVVALGLFFGAGLIDGFFKTGEPVMFQVLSVLVLAKGLNQVPDAMLKRDLDFKRRARADLTRSIGRFGIAVTLLLAGYGPVSMIIGVAVAEVAAVVVTWMLVRFKPALRFDTGIAAEMLKFGAAMFGSRLVGMLWLNGDYLVVANQYRSNSKEYGSYFTAFRLPELILGSVYNLYSNVAFPAFSAAREVGPEALRKASLKALQTLCFFGFPVGIGLSLIARDFTLWWFGAKFEGAVMPMQILSAAGGFAAVGFASGDLYAAMGKPKLGLYFNLVGTPILLGGFWLVRDRGIVWIAAVHVCVIIPYSIFRIAVANRLLGTTWAQSLAALRPAFVTVVGVVALALPVRLGMAQGFGTLLAIVAAGLVGGITALFFGDRQMYLEVRGGLAKLLARFA
jgi:lipopolysaccharide exporter